MAEQKTTAVRAYDSQDMIRVPRPWLTPDDKLTVENQLEDDTGKERWRNS